MPANSPEAEIIALPRAKDERAQMVADLRRRFLDGTLDEVLFPADKEVPDTLLQALFPHMFGAPEVNG